MRDYKTLVLEAELLASSSERVYQWLEKRASKMAGVKRALGFDGTDLELELALLKRKEPLIDLALAKFTIEDEVARELFQRNDSESSALRLAVLSNRVVGKNGLNRLPQVLFTKGFHDDGATLKWLAKAPASELIALFNNPCLDDIFLNDFLDGKEPWKAVSEDNRMAAVLALSKNPRINQEYDGYMDAWAEYSHSAVFNAAWKLAEHVPTNRSWALVLSNLFGRLKCEAFSLDNPIELSKRWVPADKEATKDDVSSNKVGHLGNYQNVRAGLGRLALAKDSDVGEKLLSSADLALRAAAYSDMRLTPEQIKAAAGRDREVAVNHMAHNETLWETEKTRQVLHDVSWDVGKKDSDLMAANAYNAIEVAMREKHPKWFANEDTPSEVPGLSPQQSKEPATKEDVHMILEAVGVRTDNSEPIVTMMKQLNANTLALIKTSGWIWWFSLGALVTLFWRR